MTDAEDLLDQTLDLLGPTGVAWAQGNRPDRNKYCIYTALACASTDMTPNWTRADKARGAVFEALYAVITEQFPDRIVDYRDPIIMFNDHDLTSFPEVKSVFEKARARLAETVTP